MYPENWKDVATQVKDDAGWKCKKCGHPHDPATWHILVVHPINGIKQDNKDGNLVALCQRCHLRIVRYSTAIREGQISLF